MTGYHPQLQLYSVAQQCLERLAYDFRDSPLVKEHVWTNHFSQSFYRRPTTMDFRDPESSFEADAAVLAGVYGSKIGEFTVGLRLMRGEGHYYRTSDFKDYDPNSSGLCDVVIPSGDLPVIIPSGYYDRDDQSFSDVEELVVHGIGEQISANRAMSLIIAMDSLEIANLDRFSLDLINQL